MFAFAAVLAATSAQAQGQSRPAPGPAGHQAVLLGTFGEWGAYTSQAGRTKVCFALAQPKERLPAGLNRDPGYLFVSFRPAENVRNEIAAVVGFPTKEDAGGQAVVDGENYALVTKGENAWVANPAEESKVVQAFMKGRSLDLKVTSGRGNASTDRYSLSGFTAAVDAARKACE